MLRLLGIMFSIGLADSLNPSTLAPGLYLASSERPLKRVLEFTLGVFSVSLIGGVILTVGPGELLFHLVRRPRPIIGYWLEIVAGAVLLVSGSLLWRYRESLAQRPLISAQNRSRRSSLFLGAGIMLVELPTAFPYFAAIATVVGSGRDIPSQVLLIVFYNVCFVLPLAGIAGVLWLEPRRAVQLLARARELIEQHWTVVLALVLMAAGAFCVLLGATGVASHAQNDFGHFAKGIHHFIT